MKSVQIDCRPTRIDFLGEFGLTDEQKREVFTQRCFFVEFYRAHYKQGTQSMDQLDYKNPIACARAKFLLMVARVIDKPALTDENYFDPKNESTETKVFMPNPNKTDAKNVPRVHVCVEVLRAPTTDDSLFAGYRFWFFVLDPRFGLLRGIENLLKENRKEAAKRKPPTDLWRKVLDANDLFYVMAAINSTINDHAANHQTIDSLNPYKLAAPNKLMYASEERRAGALSTDPRLLIASNQCIAERYLNEGVLRFSSVADAYQINFLHVNPNALLSGILPSNPLPPWIHEADPVTKNLRVNDVRHGDTERSLDRDTSEIFDSIKKNITESIKTGGYEFRTKPATFDEAIRAARTCGVEHIQRKLDWYFTRLKEETAKLPTPQPGEPEIKPDVFKAASIPVVDHTLDPLGNFFAQAFLWFDEKYTVKNMHKHVMMEWIACLSCHDLKPGLGVNIIVPGDAAKGKSFVIELLKRFTIDGTMEVFAEITPKVLNNADADFHSTTLVFHEALARFLGIDPDGKKDASEGDPILKTLFAEGVLSILRSEENPVTHKWEPVKINKKMKVTGVFNTNQPEHAMAGPVVSRFIVAPCKDVERKHHAVSDMVAWQDATHDQEIDVEPFDNLFRKIDFLVFVVFLLIEFGVIPKPELAACNLAFNKIAERLGQEGIDATDPRVFEIYKSICRVLTVMNAVIIEFCMTQGSADPNTEFDFPDLVRVIDRMVATEQIAVLAYTFLLPYKFLDSDEAKIFHAFTAANAKIKRVWNEEQHAWEYNEKEAFKKGISGETDTNWLKIAVLPNGPAVQQFAAKLRTAYRDKTSTDISQHHIAKIIKSLQERLYQGSTIIEYDQVAQAFYLSRRWLEQTLTAQYATVYLTCLDSLQYEHTKPKRVVTFYTRIDDPISKPQLLVVRDLVTVNRPRHFSITFNPDYVAGEIDMDVEEWARKLYASKNNVPEPPPNPTCEKYTAVECDRYPITQAAQYDSDQRERDGIMGGGASKRLVKASEVLAQRAERNDPDSKRAKRG